MAPDALKGIRDVYFHGDMEAAPALAGTIGRPDRCGEAGAARSSRKPWRSFSPSPRLGTLASAGIRHDRCSPSTANDHLGEDEVVRSRLQRQLFAFCDHARFAPIPDSERQRAIPSRHISSEFTCMRPKNSILGNDSTRSFYFAVQQLSVLGGVNKSLAKELPVSLAKNVEFLRRLPKLNGINGFGDFGRNLRPGLRSPLVETTGFGSNPGELRMFSFVPGNLQQPPALVVVLHGCGQTAAGYDLGAGWSTLAKHYGFALLMPEQQPSNNANGCFNWFNPEDTARDSGEACSIRQMIARMVGDHRHRSRSASSSPGFPPAAP